MHASCQRCRTCSSCPTRRCLHAQMPPPHNNLKGGSTLCMMLCGNTLRYKPLLARHRCQSPTLEHLGSKRHRALPASSASALTWSATATALPPGQQTLKGSKPWRWCGSRQPRDQATEAPTATMSHYAQIPVSSTFVKLIGCIILPRPDHRHDVSCMRCS